MIRSYDDLHARTESFVQAVISTDAPRSFVDAALNNLSTLRTETCFRTRSGDFYAFEGTYDNGGSCQGNCTIVWNYQHALSLLYPRLAHSMRRTALMKNVDERGFMPFRLRIAPDHEKPIHLTAAADGNTAALVELYRDWRWSGERKLLEDCWPHAQRALEYAWQPGGWDADRDGVMEGIQQNTYDTALDRTQPALYRVVSRRVKGGV